MNIFFFAFFFFLPAGIANMVPVFAAKLPFLRKYNQPLDFGKSFRGKRILGNHKTIRGFIVGILGGVGVVLIESHIMQISNPILLGFLLSFGALAGDSIKSFFKRRIGIPSGATWFPFDQIDYILGGLLLSLFVVRLSLWHYVTIFLLYFVLHIATTTVGYFLKLKEAAL